MCISYLADSHLSLETNSLRMSEEILAEQCSYRVIETTNLVYRGLSDVQIA